MPLLTSLLRKLPVAKGTAIGVAALGGVGLYWLLSRRDQEGEYIAARDIGKRGKKLKEVVAGKDYDYITKILMRSGTVYGEYLAKEQERMGAESEVRVSDDSLRIKGFLDTYIPETNTVIDWKPLRPNMTRPIAEHESQLNAYLHMIKADSGYLVYVDPNDINKRRVFEVPYQPGRLYADINSLAQEVMMADRVQPETAAWFSSLYSKNPKYFSGIRHSSGFAGSWKGMQGQTEDFREGRVASVVQASQYTRPVASVSLVPTMGMTIRAHELANKRGPMSRRSPAVHYNGSRRMR